MTAKIILNPRSMLRRSFYDINQDLRRWGHEITLDPHGRYACIEPIAPLTDEQIDKLIAGAMRWLHEKGEL